MKRAISALAVAAVTALVGFGGGASALAADPVSKVKGAGTDKFGLNFEFRAKHAANTTGHALFETNSFGDVTGPVDCLDVRRRKAGIAGTMENPVSGLTHFMIIMADRHRRPSDPPDEIVTWMRNGPFDCTTEPYGSLGDSLEPISEGRLRVTFAIAP